MQKRTVMLVLCRKVMAGFFIEHVNKSGSMEAFGVYKFNEAKNMASVRQPALAVVEIPERPGDAILDALDVCEDIREASPACKIVLICPEQEKISVEACQKAKSRGIIDDYVFYDCSAEYLASKLESLLPPPGAVLPLTDDLLLNSYHKEANRRI